jgi:hypothetical protein
MTAAGKRIIEDFESLSDVEKHEVLSNLLRMFRGIDHSEVSDDKLVAAADAAFRSYDEMEQDGENR